MNKTTKTKKRKARDTMATLRYDIEWLFRLAVLMNRGISNAMKKLRELESIEAQKVISRRRKK